MLKKLLFVFQQYTAYSSSEAQVLPTTNNQLIQIKQNFSPSILDQCDEDLGSMWWRKLSQSFHHRSWINMILDQYQCDLSYFNEDHSCPHSSVHKEKSTNFKRSITQKIFKKDELIITRSLRRHKKQGNVTHNNLAYLCSPLGHTQM